MHACTHAYIHSYIHAYILYQSLSIPRSLARTLIITLGCTQRYAPGLPDLVVSLWGPAGSGWGQAAVQELLAQFQSDHGVSALQLAPMSSRIFVLHPLSPPAAEHSEDGADEVVVEVAEDQDSGELARGLEVELEREGERVVALERRVSILERELLSVLDARDGSRERVGEDPTTGNEQMLAEQVLGTRRNGVEGSGEGGGGRRGLKKAAKYKSGDILSRHKWLHQLLSKNAGASDRAGAGVVREAASQYVDATQESPQIEWM